MHVGPDHQFQNFIVYLPECGAYFPPILELVAIFRAMNTYCIVFENMSSLLTKLDIQQMSTANAYNSRSIFESELKVSAAGTQMQMNSYISM